MTCESQSPAHLYRDLYVESYICADRLQRSERKLHTMRSVGQAADETHILELCISDANKVSAQPFNSRVPSTSRTGASAQELLLANEGFVPYLLDGLFLDPPADSTAAGSTVTMTFLQEIHTGCFAQLAVFAPAREVLLQNPAVIDALRAVSETGLSAETRELAEAALMALSGKEMQAAGDGPRHIMLSYQVRHIRLLDAMLLPGCCPVRSVPCSLTLAIHRCQPVESSEHDFAHSCLAVQPWIPGVDRHRDDERLNYGRDVRGDRRQRCGLLRRVAGIVR
jgi:hypothetical protein